MECLERSFGSGGRAAAHHFCTQNDPTLHTIRVGRFEGQGLPNGALVKRFARPTAWLASATVEVSSLEEVQDKS